MGQNCDWVRLWPVSISVGYHTANREHDLHVLYQPSFTNAAGAAGTFVHLVPDLSGSDWAHVGAHGRSVGFIAFMGSQMRVGRGGVARVA